MGQGIFHQFLNMSPPLYLICQVFLVALNTAFYLAIIAFDDHISILIPKEKVDSHYAHFIL
jgi:hypothetical protein